MYNYREEEIKDILDYIDTEVNLEKYEDEEELINLFDELWDEDTVTGNQSGYMTEKEHEQFIAENFQLVKDAIKTYGYQIKDIPDKNPCTWLDTLIRCYLLNDCLHEALERLKGE